MESTYTKFVDDILLRISREFLKKGLDSKMITINWINDLKSTRINSVQTLYLGRKIRKSRTSD